MQSLSTARRIVFFKTRDAEVEGFYTLLRAKMPVHSAGEHKYIITEQQCNLLQANKIEYQVERYL